MFIFGKSLYFDSEKPNGVMQAAKCARSGTEQQAKRLSTSKVRYEYVTNYGDLLSKMNGVG